MFYTKFKIKTLKQESVIKTLESITVFIFALFTTMLLPSILFKYLYQDQQLLEQPMLLEYIPIAAFAIGTGYFAYAMIGNIVRAMKIRRLEKELMSHDGNCYDDMGSEMMKMHKKSPVRKSRKSTKKSTKG